MIRSTLAVASSFAVLTAGGVAASQAATPVRAMSVALSTGTHVSESVVATAASSAVPNRYATSFPTVRAGSDASNITALAYLLLGNGVSVPVTTSYTSAVSTAVKTYQSRHGLTATGIADPVTLGALSTQLTSGTTSARTQAAATLLKKHGYAVAIPSSNVRILDAAMLAQVEAFQVGHGIARNSYIGSHTWATLFAAKTSGPIVPQMQGGTGAAQWTNCGPVSAMVVELFTGRRPAHWNDDPAANAAAVNYFRYTLVGVRDTAYDDEVGTVPANLIPALAKTGISAFSGSTNDVMTAARAGRPSIAGGDAWQLPWNRQSPSHVRGPASHFIAVVGWDGTNYLVVDPLVVPGQNRVHQVSPGQLATFGATAPGWGPNVPGNDVPPSKNNVITR